jgi:hypothetical protein
VEKKRQAVKKSWFWVLGMGDLAVAKEKKMRIDGTGWDVVKGWAW